MKKLTIFLATLLFVLFISCTQSETRVLSENNMSKNKPLDLKIIHINDPHSHLDAESLDLEINGTSTRFKVGGFPKLVTKIKKIQDEEDNLLTLHAGDQITGTLFYTLFKSEADAAMMNQIKWDAFTIGNHEFDDGDEELLKLINSIEAPVVSSNIVAKSGSILDKKWAPYLIKEINGEKIGIIGLTIVGKTQKSSNPSNDIIFIDETKAAKETVELLEEMGINKIIVLSHYGHEHTIELAKAVGGIDIIVDGDSHTLLGNSLKEFGLSPEDEYPRKVMSPRNEPTYIVQAWEYAHILGNLDVSFDSKGVITKASGRPILLLDDSFKRKNSEGSRVELVDLERDEVYSVIDHYDTLEIVENDKKTEEILSKYLEKKDELSKEIIGKSVENIPGGSAFRIPNAENPNGHYTAKLTADAFMNTLSSMGEGNIDAVIQNAGGVRTPIESGDITIETAYTLLPFSNTLYIFDLTGKEIKMTLEDAIDFALSPGGSTGAFPYASHLRYEAVKNAPHGSRVKKIEIKDKNSETWYEIDDNTTYKVGTNSYISDGKDGYTTFGKIKLDRGGVDTYLDYAKSFVDYVKSKKSISKPESTNVKFEY